jgi:hypothetical protein
MRPHSGRPISNNGSPKADAPSYTCLSVILLCFILHASSRKAEVDPREWTS